jgi:hypothetical protein
VPEKRKELLEGASFGNKGTGSKSVDGHKTRRIAAFLLLLTTIRSKKDGVRIRFVK